MAIIKSDNQKTRSCIMSDKFKDSKFYKTIKDPKFSRAAYIVLVVTLVTLAIVIGIASAANRAKKNDSIGKEEPTTNLPPVTDKTPVTESPTTDKTPTETDKPKDNPETTPPADDTPTVSVVPTLSLPVSGAVYKYHDPKVQVFSDTMNDYRVHLGVDISTTADATVSAAAAGTVSKVWKDPMMGYCIAIEHDGDAVTVYKNLAANLPENIIEGASVSAGQTIGCVGESAMIEVADEPHLHFEMTVAGLQVDPLEHFGATELASLSVDDSYGE